jgi:hypothetical protein
LDFSGIFHSSSISGFEAVLGKTILMLSPVAFA